MQSNRTEGIKHMLSFWANICKVELERSKAGSLQSSIILNNFDPLADIIQGCIGMLDFDVEDCELLETGDDETHTAGLAAGYLLRDVAELVKDKAWHRFFEFAGQKIGCENWLEKYTGLLTLQAIINGPDKNLILKACENIHWLYAFTGVENQRIRFVTACVLSSLSSAAPEVLIGD